MGAAPLGSDLACVQERLDLLPGVDVDQWLVGACLFGSFVADDADVVGVAQQFEEPRACHRSGGSLRCRNGGQAAGGDLGEQVNDGAFPGGVLLVCEPR